ncbi:MAG: sunset domain-containing protein [Intrasporangium sp.]|uniref:sunset domain-containing protein n=1 Tax=Intrasporangium sp. TaxID=1925024 RepID=UPI003F806179
MSDTQKLILWIVLAVIVIAIVALLLVRSSRRRQEEEQRRQARVLRAQAAARNANVTRAADRASVTQQVASDARTDADQSQARAQQAMEEAKARAAEAEQKAAQAERLDHEAQLHQSTAGRVQSDRDGMMREADRVDPDVESDAETGVGNDERGRAPGESAAPDEHRRETSSDGADDAPRVGAYHPVAGDVRARDEDRRPQPADEERRPVDERGPSHGTGAAGERDGGARASTWPGAVGVGSAAGAVAAAGISSAVFDDDEPDLADAENPFAPPRTHGLASERGGSRAMHGRAGDRDRAQESQADDVMRDADAGAGDTRGTTPVAPVHDESGAGAGSPMDPSAPSPSPEAQDRPAGGVFGNRPEFGDPTGSRHATRTGEDEGHTASDDEPSGDSDDSGDWVNGPVDEDAIDERPVDDVVDWINGPSDDESVTVDVPDEGSRGSEDLVAAAAAGGARGGPGIPSAPADEVIARMPEQPHAVTTEEDEAAHEDQKSEEERANVETAGSGHSGGQGDDADTAEPDPSSTGSDGSSADQGQHPGQQDHSDESATAPQQRRRISDFEEVRDGGYGVGSAAPIGDGAQPLGHAIKGVRGSRTFLAPGAQGYEDVEPDVWFYDEQSARNAGFHSSDH